MAVVTNQGGLGGDFDGSSDEESDVVTFEVRAPDGRVIELEQPIGDLVSTANEYVTDKFGKRFSYELARDGAAALDEATTLQAAGVTEGDVLVAIKRQCSYPDCDCGNRPMPCPEDNCNHVSHATCANDHLAEVHQYAQRHYATSAKEVCCFDHCFQCSDGR